jgi:hypothetical protein
MRPHKLALTLILCLGACSQVDNASVQASPEGSEVVEVEGCFSCCFESNHFIADENRQRVAQGIRPSGIWELKSAPDSFYEQLEKLAGTNLNGLAEVNVTLKIRGKLGPPGEYGHMGLAGRELEIQDFWEMKPMTKYPSCLPLPDFSKK